MGYGERINGKRLSQYSGEPLSSRPSGPKMAEWTCPKCERKYVAPLSYKLAICEPAIEPEMQRQAIAKGAKLEEVQSRKGCGWLVKLEPLGDAFSVDDVAHVGPWRPTRNEIVLTYARNVIDRWNREGKAEEIKKAMEKIVRANEIRIVE